MTIGLASANATVRIEGDVEHQDGIRGPGANPCEARTTWARTHGSRGMSGRLRSGQGGSASGSAGLLQSLLLLAMGSLRWPVAQPKRRQCVSGNWDLHTRTPNTSVEHATCETHGTMRLMVEIA